MQIADMVIAIAARVLFVVGFLWCSNSKRTPVIASTLEPSWPSSRSSSSFDAS
jgi:hypothetical protein